MRIAVEQRLQRFRRHFDVPEVRREFVEVGVRLAQAFLPDIRLVSVTEEQPMNSIGSVPDSSAAASKVWTVIVPLVLVTATGSM